MKRENESLSVHFEVQACLMHYLGDSFIVTPSCYISQFLRPHLRLGIKWQSLPTFLLQLRLRPIKVQFAPKPRAQMLGTILWQVLEEQSQILGRVGVQSAVQHQHPPFRRGVESPRAHEPGNMHDTECQKPPPPFPQAPQTTGCIFIIIDSSIVTTPTEPEILRIFKRRFTASAPPPLYLASLFPVSPLTVSIFRAHQKEPLWNIGQSLTAVRPAGEARPGLCLTKERGSGELCE